MKKKRKHQTWITGPSAKGSEYGTPSSIMSDPQESSTFSASAVVERSGSPAVIYGMKATLTQIYFLENIHLAVKNSSQTHISLQ